MLQPDGTAAPVRHHFVGCDLFVRRKISRRARTCKSLVGGLGSPGSPHTSVTCHPNVRKLFQVIPRRYSEPGSRLQGPRWPHPELFFRFACS